MSKKTTYTWTYMVHIDVSMLIISKHCGCAVVLDDNMILCFARVVHGITWCTLLAIVYSLNAWIPFIIVKCTNYINTKGIQQVSEITWKSRKVNKILGLSWQVMWLAIQLGFLALISRWSVKFHGWELKGVFSLSLFGWISEYNSHPSIQQLDLLVATSKISIDLCWCYVFHTITSSSRCRWGSWKSGFLECKAPGGFRM